MTNSSKSSGNNATLYVVLAVVAAAVCFIISYAFMGSGKKSAAPVVASGDTGSAGDPGAAPAADPATAAGGSASVAAAPATVPAAPAPDPASEIAWSKIESGCTIDVKDGVVHISGQTSRSNWQFNGVQTVTGFPAADFTASVDFKCVKFKGPGNQTVYLRAGSGNNCIGVYFNPSYYYQMHTWEAQQQHSATHKLLGDESTKFHTLKLKYDAATQTTTSYVDDDVIGTLHYALTGNVHMWLVANTQAQGMDIDVYYQNFELVTGAPATNP